MYVKGQMSIVLEILVLQIYIVIDTNEQMQWIQHLHNNEKREKTVYRIE